MNRIYNYFFFILFFSAACLQAQITIDNSYFPEAGDTLSTVSLIPQLGQIPITDSGNDQLWDYSQISGGIATTVTYDSYTPINDDPFPDANLVIRGSDGETFINSTETEFSILGFSGLDPAGLGVSLASTFFPPLKERVAPLEFLDLDTYSTSSDITFGADILPAAFLDSLIFAPDSLRVRINIDLVDLVDAWGTVILPSNIDYNVLRQKRVQLSETRLEVKVPILDWVDVTDQFAGGAGGGGFLGMDTTVTYSFWSQGVKEPIAELTLDALEENVVAFSYKAEEPIMSSASEIKEGYENVYAYPNPAINYAKFDFVNLKPDYYELKIYNILGLEAYKERNFISGNKMIQVDLSTFQKGTYLYSLTDTTGKVILTKRIVVIRP